MVRPLTADLLALLNNPIAIYRDGLRWVVLPHDAHDVARACQQSYDEWSGPLILSDKITQRSLHH